eukprot:TRINITY_DN24009_c0_g1_i2.p1 TRINITY_DN24009_c0_g1~~TRINITY_DN24009_c0_g1_i2.p1  ORF type:complete len:393 (-),score=15.56 TRINITY_DN24009_c0_g1_i2:575-1753(-)
MAGGVHPSRWCITRADLDVFEREVHALYNAGGIPDDPAYPNELHDDVNVGPSMYRVTECYIKPATAEAGTSWALMRHPAGLLCDVFVSHCWSEGVFEFSNKVRQLWPWDARHLYCCSLSNPQNGDVGLLLGGDPMRSPFAKALASAKYVLVIPNQRQSLYCRLWCVFEAHLALECGHIIRLPWRPSTKRVSLTVAYALLCFGFAAVLGFWFGNRDWFLRGRQVIWVCLALGLRVTWKAYPRRSSLLALFVLGATLGVVVRVGFRVQDEGVDAFIPLHVTVLDMTFIILALAFDSLQEICAYLIAQAVASEGYKLQFDTVRSATATNERDEHAIKAAIRGMEDIIDHSIAVLKGVGRYDKAVRFNLRHGMSLEHVRRGFRSCLAVCGLTLRTN